MINTQDSNHTFIVHKCYIQEGIVNTRVHNHTRTLPLNNSAFYYYIHSFYRNNRTRFVTRGCPSHCTPVQGPQIKGSALRLVRASGTHHGIITNNKWLSVGGSDYHISSKVWYSFSRWFSFPNISLVTFAAKRHILSCTIKIKFLGQNKQLSGKKYQTFPLNPLFNWTWEAVTVRIYIYVHIH